LDKPAKAVEPLVAWLRQLMELVEVGRDPAPMIGPSEVADGLSIARSGLC
jgi:hypothetical protein